MTGVQTCALPISNAHGQRYVRIQLAMRGAPDDSVATLGHELQHALEASQAPTLRNVGEYERYFRSIGIDREPKRLDTLAARQTGKQVADELRGMGRPRGAVALASTN